MSTSADRRTRRGDASLEARRELHDANDFSDIVTLTLVIATLTVLGVILNLFFDEVFDAVRQLMN